MYVLFLPAGQHHDRRVNQRHYGGGGSGEFSMLPSPMQLFSTSSAVTTVQVEHPPPDIPGNWDPVGNSGNWEGQGQQHQIGVPEESLLRPQMATFTKTTSAKRISTSSFKREEDSRAVATAYDSIVSLPKLNVAVEEGEDIKVVHFGVV